MNEFLFGIYPYIAITVFLLGSMFRYDREQYTWKAGSSQMLSSKGMRVGSNLFHIGIILLFFGHLVGLLVPESIYHHFMTAGQKQLIAMIAGGIFGTICLIGMVILIHRRLTNARIRATTKFSDIFILLLLFVQLILGLLTLPVSAQHMDGSSMVALANWAQHIVTFRSGAADFVLNQALIFKLHIFFGLTMFLVFPFTRLVHIWSAPVKYVFRKGYQIVRKR
ncbi:MAG: respiratory nitrate reductase subunit gamma [Proteobacteria bacterium]|nr:respiratory nitrate reductase subunit gamma [Pseudomonadota bacterium]